MKKPLAYITAAWSGNRAADMEQAAGYCRTVYEAGFSPVCPLLYLPLFINDAIPQEHKDGIDIRGAEADEDVKNDIAVAQRLNITATTLTGIITVKQQGREAHE